jgi:hypothetical protein
MAIITHWENQSIDFGAVFFVGAYVRKWDILTRSIVMSDGMKVTGKD